MSVPHLSLAISHSPLLATSPLSASAGPDDNLLSTLMNKCTLEDLHARSSSSRHRYLSHNTQPAPHSPTSNLAPRPSEGVDTDLLGKPLPALPSQPPIPPHAIISILNILDAFDKYTACETARVNCNIRDVYDSIKMYKTECQARLDHAQKKQEREKRETKEIDSDFWLGV
ncbi:hypothetical protein BD779DRAFT_138864 [Infundibulicybe gibba]|nr:hypothetical protein BD779DRAFT_138864 [Infundibulicybe gibba]